ncbi:PcfJ domain-containing protein [Clostridium sp. A1-XYC3]|uniref:PcfJ domain-containing protein n=1 Tax=Clostridium tanneri TaxID=3037988 RepID=A0ABU4JX42_9CLOT|nr:PcfJ domain-containing protein [Clostridium sp. A1-XYC3]MDW8802508.1 PcfJ domain-containing protein [Clostridium sp. A1-XYC3]
MNIAAIAENIGYGKVVTDIYSGNVKCSCGRKIKFNELSLGGFGNSLSCSCGDEFWPADEDIDELLVYEGYDYIISEAFVMVKQRVYSKIDWRKNRLTTRNLKECNEYLYIDFENNLFAYFDDRGRGIKDGGKSFFKNISIEDMKNLSSQIELYCSKNKIVPNYGSILKKLSSYYNTYEYEIMLKKVLSEYYVESFAKEGLSYLIEYNFLHSLQILEKTIYIDKAATTCSKILGVPKKVICYIRENRLKASNILELQRFFRENNYNDFKEFLCSENSIFEVSDLHYLNFLLRNGYSAHRLNKYAAEIINEEDLGKSSFLTYLVDSVRMSKAGDLEFKLYGRRLKQRHDELASKYKLVKNEIINKKLLEISRDIVVNQYGDKYVAIIPKSVKDFEEEGQNQKNCVLSYAESMVNGDIIILFIRDKNELDKSYITLEIRKKKIVQAKKFANGSINYEDKEYLEGLAKANKWL